MGHDHDHEENTHSLRAKYRFSPIESGYTSTRLRITQNLAEDLFLCILLNSEVKRTLFGKAKKNFKMLIITQKIHHRKFCQIE
jgi:hypothetical protein